MKIYAYATVDFVVATLAARPSARVAQPIIERGGAPSADTCPNCEADAVRPNRFWTRGRMRRRAKPGGEVAGGDGKADRKGPRGA